MKIRRACVALAGAALAVPSTVGAVSLQFTHAYGEIVDRGDVSAHIVNGTGPAFECPTSVSIARSGNSFTLTAGVAPPGQAGTGSCLYTATVLLGSLPAGAYDVTARLRSLDGAIVDSVTQALVVLPTDGRCNRDPALSPAIVGTPRDQSPAEFVARVRSDPDFASALGNPAVRVQDHLVFDDEVYFDYPPLEDIPPAMDRLARAGVLASQWRNGRVCLGLSPPDEVTAVLEFFDAGLGQYFYSGDVGEIAAIDAGRVGTWVRTGRSFRAVANPGCAASTDNSVVYRFHGIEGAEPGSHFFTRDRAECHTVDRSRRWSFEGLPFWASEPKAGGACGPLDSVYPPMQRVPLYRVWRPFGASTHRLTTDRAVVAQMVAQGWIDEGAAMCVLPPR